MFVLLGEGVEGGEGGDIVMNPGAATGLCGMGVVTHGALDCYRLTIG